MSKLPPPMNLEGMNLEAIHEAIQDCHDWPGKNHPDDTYHLGMRAVCTAMRLESALEAAQQEIAARDAEIEALREEVRLTNEHEHAIMMELSAARDEIADLKRDEVVVQDVVRGVTHMGISWEVSRPGDYYWERGAWREWKADGQMANASSFAWIRPFPVRPIPADRELMRLVDELIRWHGLRPLDKRPDHAAVLVGAIKALRTQPTQEPTT